MVTWINYHEEKDIRLQNYDYSQAGYYFLIKEFGNEIIMTESLEMNKNIKRHMNT